MPFVQEIQPDSWIEKRYGKYIVSFHSENGQVEADVFERNGKWIAHVAAVGKLDIEDVTDIYASELNRYAKDHGYEGRVEIIYHVDYR